MSWFHKRKIVVPIDFSDESFNAFETAMEIAEQPSAVHVIHVLPDLSPAEPGVVWGEINNENRARHATEALRERLPDDSSSDVQIEIEFGDPGYRIADRAKQLEADLVVMPSHGRGGLKRLLIGSVAERVARLAHCPVLILRK